MQNQRSPVRYDRLTAAIRVTAQAAPSLTSHITTRPRWWRTMMLVSVVMSIILVTGIQLTIRPTYKVTARLEVTSGSRSGVLAGGNTWIQQQQHVAAEFKNLASSTLLNEVLSDPSLQAFIRADGATSFPTHVTYDLTVTPLDGTRLIEVALVGDHADYLSSFVNAMVHAYLRHRENQAQSRQAQILKGLVHEQQRFQEKLAANAADYERSRMASRGMVELSSKAIDRRIETLRQELPELKRNKALASARLSALSAVRENDGAIGGEVKDLDEFFSHDQQLSALRQELEQVEGQLLQDERAGRLPGHPDARLNLERRVALQQRIPRRKNELRRPYVESAGEEIQTELGNIDVAMAVVGRDLDRLAQQRAPAIEQEQLLQRIRSEQQHNEQELSMIRQEIRDAKLRYRNELRVFAHSSAVAPPSPNVDPRPLYSLGALLLSIATGAGIALVRARRAKYGAPGESAYRRQADIFVGSQEMPEDRGLPAGIYRQDLTSTSTSSHLALAVARTTAQSRLITSPLNDGGSSAVAIDIARNLSSTGRRVLLIDASTHCSEITRTMQLVDRPGLGELLSGRVSIPQAIYRTDIWNLDILPAGTRTTWRVEVSPISRVADLVESVFQYYEEVVLNAPPVFISDTIIPLVNIVDEVLVVCRPGRDGEDQARLAWQFLSANGKARVRIVPHLDKTAD